MKEEEALKRMMSGLEGRISAVVWRPKTGERFAYRAEEPQIAASVIKIPIMIEAFRQREAGTLDFDGETTVKEEDKMPSCGALTYMHTGLRVTIRDLVTLMIILSDNTATNMLIERLGMDNVNATMEALGMSPGTRLRRKLFDAERARQGIQNTVTAADMAALLGRMLEGTLISPEASREMLRIMGDQRLNGKMPFYLHSRGIDCAHKTGEDDGITHDVGIIGTEPETIFCFLSSETDVPAAERAIQDAAALLAGI